MITEAPVIRMLLNRHNLNCIIARLFDARQNVFFKLNVSADFLGVLRHADVAFINQKRFRIDFKAFVVPLVRLRRIPNLRGENFSFIVLNDALTPSGNTFALAVVPTNFHFVKVAVFHLIFREFEFPVAAFDFFATISLIFLPAVEIAD